LHEETPQPCLWEAMLTRGEKGEKASPTKDAQTDRDRNRASGKKRRDRRMREGVGGPRHRKPKRHALTPIRRERDKNGIIQPYRQNKGRDVRRKGSPQERRTISRLESGQGGRRRKRRVFFSTSLGK